jgi:hypothetical protein
VTARRFWQTYRVIGDVLTAAVGARQSTDAAGFERSLDLLVMAPRPEVSATLVQRLATAVGNAWMRGWQPADVTRAVRRAHGVRHARLVVDMIAERMAGQPADTVDDRWAAQLRTLDARVWWTGGDAYLERWAAREGVEPIMATRYAVEVLAAVEALPGLPRLLPPPGIGPVRRAPRRSGRDAASRMLERVRSLLAKAESSEFASEAEAYTAKAQELIARHSIDHALLHRGDDRDQPVAVRVTVDSPYEEAKALLLQKVAEATMCRSVWSAEFGFATVFGFTADIAAVELMYGSLLVQGTATMVREGSGGRTKSFRQSFLYAYAVRIGQRLRTATDDARTDARTDAETGAGTDELLPVLASREQAVEERVAEVFAKFTSRRPRINDERGWISGTAAADRARLEGRRAVDG